MEFFQGKPINIVPPLSMEFVVVETEKNMKGSTVQASYKPAKLEGGLEVTVPPFIEPGSSHQDRHPRRLLYRAGQQVS